MIGSTIKFAQRGSISTAKTGLSLLFVATTVSTVMAYDTAEFPGRGNRSDFESAGKHYNRAIDLGSQGKELEALEEYKSAISIYPYKAGYYYNYGNTLKKLKQQSAALDAYKKAIELDPNMLEAYDNMGDLLTNQGKYLDAEAVCKRALEIDPAHTVAMINLAEALMGEPKKEEAIKWLKSAKASPGGGSDPCAKVIGEDLQKANAMIVK